MKCNACRHERDDVRLVLRHRRAGFGYATERLHLCTSCFPEPAAPAASSSPSSSAPPSSSPVPLVGAAGSPLETSHSCADMEGNANEVETGNRAVSPAHLKEIPERRPGSCEGPGRVSPGAVVGREAGGR